MGLKKANSKNGIKSFLFLKANALATFQYLPFLLIGNRTTLLDSLS